MDKTDIPSRTLDWLQTNAVSHCLGARVFITAAAAGTFPDNNVIDECCANQSFCREKCQIEVGGKLAL